MQAEMCDICGKEPAIIEITGKGKYCRKCHNNLSLTNMGIDDTFEYTKIMTVVEPSGEIHTFDVEHMIFGGIVDWTARERGGDYEFRYISYVSQNGAAAAQRFFQKIVDGVCTKALKECPSSVDNAVLREGKLWSLGEKGTIHIIQDEDRGGETSFVIDGKKFTGKELEILFSSNTEFMLQYQIHDESEPILKEDEYLVPTRITRESLISELEMAIQMHGDRGFLSYKNLSAFDEVFLEIVKKLEVLYLSEKLKDALAAGREMVRILAHTETDDDYFPEYDINYICETVDPYGHDQELKDIVQEWRDSF